MKKRGDMNKPIISSSTILNAKNIIFMLIILLLLIIIVYFAIKTWPIMQERISDEDDDGIKNYKDKCPNTLAGTTVDQFGCELEKSTQEKESTPVKQDTTKVNENLTKVEGKVCSDSDGGKDIWNKGICRDTVENKDYCKTNFESRLYEYECLNNTCTRLSIDCSDYNALCYDGRCIEKTKDSDKDGYPDLEELGNDTDPKDPNDYPGNITTQSNCNSKCLSLGYIRGRGPFNSMGSCDNVEIGKYLSGNAGDICCCKDCGLWCKSSSWNYGTITTSSNCNTYPTNYYDDEFSCCCHMETGGQEIDTDKDGIPDSTDTDDDNDGFTDQEEEQKGTDPKDPNSYPQESNCKTLASQYNYNYYESWSSSSAACGIKANTDCQNKGLSLKSYLKSGNCCMWSCKETLTNEQKCQQWMTSGGYSYWALGISSSQACYDKAVQDCANRGQQYSLSVYQDPTMGCCNWKCKEIVNPNTGLDCESTAVIPSSQGDCSLRVGCSSDSYCRFMLGQAGPNYNKCLCKKYCVDSDVEAGYTGASSWQHKGYCMMWSEVINYWDTCVDSQRLTEWICDSNFKCKSYTEACSEFFEAGYCKDGECKSCKDICESYYLHSYYSSSPFTTQEQCVNYANSWCLSNKGTGWQSANRPASEWGCCCWNCHGE